MNLKLVTFTGADDSISPEALAQVSKKYPFVEWGILVSERLQMPSGGKAARFPSLPWIEHFARVAQANDLKVAMHLCGRGLRALMIGETDSLYIYAGLIKVAQRIQLNFHAEPVRWNSEAFGKAVAGWPHQFIFQQDGRNGWLLNAALSMSGLSNAVPLFDLSHGAGVYPSKWPLPDFQSPLYGYAGGIGPDNVIQALNEIGGVLPDESAMWIDMETKVRSDDDQTFEITKVVNVLEQVQRDRRRWSRWGLEEELCKAQ